MQMADRDHDWAQHLPHAQKLAEREPHPGRRPPSSCLGGIEPSR